MDPNESFRQARRRTETKKKCKHCGRVWEQLVEECVCGNSTRWIGASKQLPKAFHVWECKECGFRQNLYGGVISGGKWLNDHPHCASCGSLDPGYSCLTKPGWRNSHE